MSWFANIDDDGINQGFYNSDFQTVPKGARPIFEEQYQDWLAKGKFYYWWPKGDKSFSIRPVSNEEKLAKAKSQKNAELKAACANDIIKGCSSDALGKTYIYPTQSQDVQNVSNSTITALTEKLKGDNQDKNWKIPTWCYDTKKAQWSFVDHKADQIVQVQSDIKAYTTGIQNHYADLLSKVEGATTEAQVLAIQW